MPASDNPSRMEHAPGGIACGPTTGPSIRGSPLCLLAFLLLGGFGALLRFGVIRHVYERLDVSRRATSAARHGGGTGIPFFQRHAQRAREPAVVGVFAMWRVVSRVVAWMDAGRELGISDLHGDGVVGRAGWQVGEGCGPSCGSRGYGVA